MVLLFLIFVGWFVIFEFMCYDIGELLIGLVFGLIMSVWVGIGIVVGGFIVGVIIIGDMIWFNCLWVDVIK